jgi:hypothetical protein
MKARGVVVAGAPRRAAALVALEQGPLEEEAEIGELAGRLVEAGAEASELASGRGSHGVEAWGVAG